MTHDVNLIYRPWDSDFFNRKVYELTGLTQGSLPSTYELQEMLDVVLTDETVLVQTKTDSSLFHYIPVLEDAGFRFVDSRIEFLTTEERVDKVVLAPTGVFRDFTNSDWNQVSELTFLSFAGNPSFHSRYNNRQYFSINDSKRYFLQWHKLALENSSPMFCIWEVAGEICGFYTIVRRPNEGKDGLPLYKVGLGAVKEGYRSFGAQNLMQQWLFSRAVDSKWVTVNSPALTNKAGIKNNIRAQKNFDRAEVFMFANRGSRSR